MKPLIKRAQSPDAEIKEVALAELQRLGMHPVMLAVYDEPKLFWTSTFDPRAMVYVCMMHSWKEARHILATRMYILHVLVCGNVNCVWIAVSAESEHVSEYEYT